MKPFAHPRLRSSTSMPSAASTWLVLMLPALFVTAAVAQTTLPEVQVTTAAIADYEFDWGRYGVPCASCNFGDGNARFVFSDAANNLWLGHIDYQSGNFYPPDGHGVLIDTGVAAATDFGNGPEWMYSASGSAVVYTKFLAQQPHSALTAGVAVASMINGAWSGAFVPSNPLGRNSPLATVDVNDPAPRFSYVDANRSHQYWRSMTSLNVEHALPISQISDGSSRRWVPGTHSLIFAGKAPPDPSGVVRNQMFLYDTDAGTLQQLTFEPTDKLGGFMWQAPEFNNEKVFFTIADRKQLLVYRKLPNAQGVPTWTVACRVR